MDTNASSVRVIGIAGRKGCGKTTAAEIICEHVASHHPNVRCVVFSFADPLKEMIKHLFFLRPSYHLNGKGKEQTIQTLGVSPRYLMQHIGTDLFRDALQLHLPDLNLDGQTIWIWHMHQRMSWLAIEMHQVPAGEESTPMSEDKEKTISDLENAIQSESDCTVCPVRLLIVISDVRFVDEAKFLRDKWSSLLVHITRDQTTDFDDSHSSPLVNDRGEEIKEKSPQRQHSSETTTDQLGEYVDVLIENNEETTRKFRSQIVGIVEEMLLESGHY